MLLSMLRSLQLLIVENVQYISVGSELFTKKNAKLHTKII